VVVSTSFIRHDESSYLNKLVSTMLRNYGLLNVVAHPHPEGIYRQIFEKAALSSAVKFRGDRYATISQITETQDGVFRGRLATWSEIDPKSPSVNKSSLEEMTLAEAGIKLPDNIGFNSAIFYFAFRMPEHALYVELSNSEGRSISPNSARKAFDVILGSASAKMVDELNVFLGSKSDAIDHVLSLKSIRKIKIDLKLPNPDDLSEAHQAALDKINSMKAQRLEATFTRAVGEDTLVLIPEWRAVTDLALNNGYVATTGINEFDEISERSTKDFPAEITEELADEDTGYRAVRRVAVEGRELPVFDDPEIGEVLE
jgi:hypothetical protein